MDASHDITLKIAAKAYVGRLLYALEDREFARAEGILEQVRRLPLAEQEGVLRAFQGCCEDAVLPNWKIMTRLANCGVRTGFFRLAELALERLSAWPVGLPQVYAEGVRLSLACARLDLAAIYMRELETRFADEPATAATGYIYREAEQVFHDVANLDDTPSESLDDICDDPRLELGRVLTRMGRPAHALDVCRSLADEPNSTKSVFAIIGDAYYLMGEFELAARAYRRLLVSGSGDFDTRWMERLGDAHLAGGDPQVAVRCFGYCSYQKTHDVKVRRKLALATGKIWRNRLITEAWERTDGAPRYFDCFMFNGEVALAKMRFTELWDHVEKFIVVEAAETFTGNKKSLMFKENLESFKDFRDKIIHVVVESFPESCEYPWAKDFYQRDALVRGLDGLAADNDFVVIADADELWRWDVVRRFEGEVSTMRMRMVKNFVNYQSIGDGRTNRDTAAIARYGLVRQYGASAVRFNLARRRRKEFNEWLDDAGWHFHALGDEHFIRYKFSSYAHREHHNKPDLVQLDFVRARLDRIRAGQLEDGWVAAPLGQFLPESIRCDPEVFREVVLEPDEGIISEWIRRLSATI